MYDHFQFGNEESYNMTKICFEKCWEIIKF